MAKAEAIPVIDVDLESDTPWSDALRPYRRGGQSLVNGFNTQAEQTIGRIPWWAVKKAGGALHSLLGDAHGAEIDDIAEALEVDVTDIVLANAAYDISNVGCSTIAATSTKGPLHARNLDWSFPRGLLKKHLVVAHMRNAEHGDYALVTWPGMFGALTGIAPGRFSITVNFVTHEGESNARGLASRALGGYWPVAWVVRRAFDEAEDFQEAVDLLKDEPLLSPVLLTVVGTNNDERVVIECGCDDYELREPDGKEALLVTNHYELDETDGWNVDLDDSDTCERYDALEKLLEGEHATPASLLQTLTHEDVFADDGTQHQVVMQPATGRLVVRVPGRPTLDIELE